MGKIPYALSILTALGFVENEGGSLALDPGSSFQNLEGRRLELEVGLEMLKKRIKSEMPREHEHEQGGDATGRERGTLGGGISGERESKIRTSTNTSTSRVLPGRATTAAAVAAELSHAAKGIASPNSVSSAAKSKDEKTLEEEKIRRHKAEIALNQQKSLVQDLQSQILELKDAENQNSPFRQSTGASRLNAGEKDDAKFEAMEPGRESFADNTKNAATGGGRGVGARGGSKTATNREKEKGKDKSAGSSKAKDKPRSSTMGSPSKHLSCLTHAAYAGDTRLQVSRTEGFSKGMHIIVGSGLSAECHLVAGFGGVLIDTPLTHSHAVGAVVRVLPPIKSSLSKIHRIVGEEFIRGLLLDVIASRAVDLVCERQEVRELNALYASRPMLKHTYTVEAEHPIHTITKTSTNTSTMENNVKGISVHSNHGKMYSLSKSGKLSSLDFSLHMVDMVNLFTDCVPRTLPQGDASESEQLCDVRTLLDHVEVDFHARGVLQQLAEGRGFSTFLSMVQNILQNVLQTSSLQEGLMSWSSFCSILRPSFPTSLPTISQSDRASLKLKYDVDRVCLDLLLKVFRLTDSDDDDYLSLSEVAASFAELDGSFTDTRSLTQAMGRVLGSHSEEEKLSAVNYVTVRAEYAAIVDTLPGGLYLEGRQAVHGVIDSLSAGSNHAVEMVSIPHLLSTLPARVLACMCLKRSRPLSAILEELPSLTRRDRIAETMSCRSVVGSATHRTVEVKDVLDVVHICSSSNKETLYILSKDGVLHLFDVGTSTGINRSRVLWAEPRPLRAVEGGAKLLKWCRSSGANYVSRPGDTEETVSDMQLKGQDLEKTSSQLASFIFSLPVKNSPLSTAACVAVDEETGLIAINCSASSGSICILEPFSLQRLYRVRAPGRASKDLSDAVQSICSGDAPRVRPAPHLCAGSVSLIVLWSRRGLMLCSLFGSPDVHVVSLLSGDALTILSGHAGTLTCISIDHIHGVVFTGVSDGHVRVWVADECIPHRLTSTSVTSDPSLAAMENMVTRSAVPGTVSHQTMRTLSSRISSKLKLSAQWRRGKIVSFYHPSQSCCYSSTEQNSLGVEVVFEDGSLQIYSNRVQLRHPREMDASPKGPPLWSHPGAHMAVDEDVAIFEIDPACAASACVRERGLSVSASQTVSATKKILTQLLDLSDADSCTLDDVFDAIGYEKHSLLLIPIYTAVRRIYKYSEKLSSKCDRLLVGNAAPIVSISLCNSSKLVVSIDQGGTCCVFDPSLLRVSLTVNTTFDPTASVGSHPYALVHRSNMSSSVAHLSSPHGLDSDDALNTVRPSTVKICVTAVDTVITASSAVNPFPMSGDALSKAIALDSAFTPDDVTVKGFVYVMRDLTSLCFETSCFLPSMVVLDSPQHFMTPHTQDKRSSSCTKMQTLYSMRESVLRVVYVVSCTHRCLEALCEDLRHYGVLQRGYTTTPSELIELVCFERPKGWLEHSKELLDSKALGPETQRSSTGIVTALTDTNNVHIALDYSNDVISIDADRVLAAWDGFADSQSHMTRRSGMIGVGSRVKFLPASSGSEVIALEAEAQNVLMVSVCGAGDRGSFSAVIPLLVGRSSYPLPADELYLDTPSSRDTAVMLNNSFSEMTGTALGRLSAHTCMFRTSRAAWSDVFRAYQSRVWDATCGHASAPSALRNMSLLTSFSGIDVNVRAMAVDFFLSMSSTSMRLSPSHPLLHFLDGLLGGRGSTLLDALDAKETSRCHLEDLQAAVLTRTGLHPQELLRHVWNLSADGLRSLTAALDGGATVRSKTPGKSDPLGPVTSFTIAGALEGGDDVSVNILGAVGASNAASEMTRAVRAVVKSLKDRDKQSTLTSYLVRHCLSCAIAEHVKVEKMVSLKAGDAYLHSLSMLSQPLLLAVKDSPPLLAPAFEKILRSFPSRRAQCPEGLYSVIHSKPHKSLFPGVDMAIVTAVRGGGGGSGGGERYTFMTFTERGSGAAHGGIAGQGIERFDRGGADMQSSSALTGLSTLMTSTQQDNAVLVQSIQGVIFDDRSLSPHMVLDWDEGWHPLRSLLAKHNGLFNAGQVDLFRTQITRILDSLMELDDRGVVAHGLSPDTVIFDESGTKVRILLLPVARNGSPHRVRGGGGGGGGIQQLLKSYTDCCSGDAQRLACIPPLASGDTSTVDVDGHESSWDVWSFGSMVFMLAFGIEAMTSPPVQTRTEESHKDEGKHRDRLLLSESETHSPAAAVLRDLMVMSNTPEDDKQRSRAYPAGESADTHKGQPMTRPSKVSATDSLDIFELIHRITGMSLQKLSSFRGTFCKEAPVCGLSDRAVSLLWEKMMQSLFFKLCGGTSSLLLMQARLSRLPKDMSSAGVLSFVTEHLGLVLTSQELAGLVKSLSGDMVHSLKPFQECARRMLKSISGMLDEVLWYGTFQQLLYLLSRCLHPDPLQRGTLRELRRLAIFGLSDDEATAGRAKKGAELITARYASPQVFCSSVVVDPFVGDLVALMALSDQECETVRDLSFVTCTDDLHGAASTYSALERLITCMECVEELVSLTVQSSNAAATESVTLGPCLSMLELDPLWVKSNSVAILQAVMDSELIPGIALYLLRFLSTYAAQKSSDVRMFRGRDRASDVKGLSTGSRLIMRMSEFLQYLVSCLVSLSRDISLPSALSAAMARNTETETDRGNDDDAADGREGDDLIDALRVVATRRMCESLYWCSVRAAVMLYTGEESPLSCQGPYQETLTQAHSVLLHSYSCPHHRWSSLSTAMESRPHHRWSSLTTAMESRWSAHTCRLFEPVLLDLVGEDGKGSSKMTLAGECLQHAERRADLLRSYRNSTTTDNSSVHENRATRGAAVFAGMLKVFRALCAEDATTGRAKGKSHTVVVTAITLYLPVSVPIIRGVLESDKKGNTKGQGQGQVHSAITSVSDSATTQRLQLLLDTRSSAVLQYYFNSKEPGLQSSLLKACQRVLSACLRTSAEEGMSEPFRSVGLDFSSEGWVHGISEILRVKIEIPDLSLLAVECLRLMASKREWMRCWSVFDVLPILCFLTHGVAKGLTAIRIEVKEALRLCTMHRPEGTAAMVSLRMPHAEEIPGQIGACPVSVLLAEASDLTFGSTIAEQSKFSDVLSEWVSTSFPSELPNGVCGVTQWGDLFDLCSMVYSWLPKLCLALQINDEKDGKKEKLGSSVEVACRQIAAVERIMLHAGVSGTGTGSWSKGGAVCKWTSPADAVRAPDGTGLMACLEQLATAGAYAATFLSLKLQCQIVRTLCRMLRHGGKEVVGALLDFDIIRCLLLFIQCVVDATLNATRQNQVIELNRAQREMFGAVSYVWRTIIAIKSHKAKEDIISAGVIQRLVEQWLPCTASTSTALRGSSSSGADAHSTLSPLTVRSMGISMLRDLLPRGAAVNCVEVDDHLVSQLSIWLQATGTVKRELQTMQTLIGAGGKGGTNIAGNMRKTAVDIIMSIAAFFLSALDDEMKVLVFSAFPLTMHLYCSMTP